MRGLTGRLLLFFGSYAPLFLMLGVRWLPVRILHATTREWLASIIFGALTLLSVLAIVIVREAAAKTSTSTVVPYEIRDVGGSTVGYLTSYILPWFMFETSRSWPTWAGFFVYMLVLGYVATRSRMIVTNPTLMLFGWRVFEVKVKQQPGTEDEFIAVFMVLAKSRPPGGEPLAVAQFDEELIVP